MSAEQIPAEVIPQSRKRGRPNSTATPTGWVAAEVRSACVKSGVNQRDLAKVFEVSHATVSRRWLGDIAWDADELVTIAVMTDTPPKDFMPPLDFGAQGPLAQLVELRTFNPKSARHLRLVSSLKRTPSPVWLSGR